MIDATNEFKPVSQEHENSSFLGGTPHWSSTTLQRTTAMNFSPSGSAPLATQTETQGSAHLSGGEAMASFTSEGILTEGHEDEPDLKVRKLSTDEVVYLTMEVEPREKECNDIFSALAMDGQRRPFKTLKLCCEPNSGLTTAVEARGGVGIRCGDLNKKSGSNRVLELIKTKKPDVMWVYPGAQHVVRGRPREH